MRNKLQFSKVLVILITALFIICLCKFYGALSDMIESGVGIADLTAYGIPLTISGTIFATANVWYFKKSQVENTYKLKVALFKDACKIDIKWRTDALELSRQYGDSSLDFVQCLDCPIDRMEGLNGANNTLDEAMNDGAQLVQREDISMY